MLDFNKEFFNWKFLEKIGGLTFFIFFVIYSADSSVSLKVFSRRQLYDMLNNFKGKKLEEKFLLLEDNLIKLTKCPEEQKDEEDNDDD